MSDALTTEQRVLPFVLDACCGPRMMWFDKADPRALFIDKRQETHAMNRYGEGSVNRSPAVIAPDVVADFTSMPFHNDTLAAEDQRIAR